MSLGRKLQVFMPLDLSALSENRPMSSRERLKRRWVWLEEGAWGETQAAVHPETDQSMGT